MSTVERLFFGGPLHGRRLGVAAGETSVNAHKPVSVVGYFRAEDEPFVDDWEDRMVRYERRRIPGSAEQVFVAPDFTYDTPEWLAYDTEAWVAEKVPDVTGWEHLGPWRWRGRPVEGTPGYRPGSWLYVLLDRRGIGRAGGLVGDEFVEDDLDITEHVFTGLQQYIDEHSLPTCVVPACAEKGRAQFWAAEDGRLAGRAWRKGDEIRLCPPHAADVHRAVGAYGRDRLAEWLRPDADVYDGDIWTRLGRHHWGEDSVTRVIRLAQRVEHHGVSG